MLRDITSYLFCVIFIAMATGLGYGSASSLAGSSFSGNVQHRKLFPFSREVRSIPENAQCLTIPYLSELKDRFIRWLDSNNNGQADFQEVKEYMRKFKPNVKDDAVTAFIRRRDMNGNGKIDLIPEYVRDMSAPDYTLDAATEWFRLQDTDDNNFVNEDELLNVTKALGMSPEEGLEAVRGYYMGADINKDGQLSFEEFKTLYNQ